MSENYLLNFTDSTTVSFPPDTSWSQYTSVTISEGFLSIPYACFKNFSKLIYVYLPDSLTSIDNGILIGTQVRSFKIPRGVKYLSTDNPFDDTPGLEHIDVDPENQNYCSVDGILFTKDMKTLIYFPSSKNITFYNIPNGVIAASHAAFSRLVFLKNVVFPQSFLKFGQYNFQSCNVLESIIVYRDYRQKEIIYSYGNFIYSTFKTDNITYIYSISSCPTYRASYYLPLSFITPIIVFFLT